MNVKRTIILAAGAIVAAVVYALDVADVYPSWLLVGPVLLGIGGVVLLTDQVLCAPSRKGGFIGSLMMIGLSAGTVTQDALLVVDEWSIWPFVAGALLFGVPLETYASHRRHNDHGPASRATPHAA